MTAGPSRRLTIAFTQEGRPSRACAAPAPPSQKQPYTRRSRRSNAE